MNSEMNTTESSISPVTNVGTVTLDEQAVREMRHRLHELANVFTGVMIAGGLLSQYLETGALGHYASDICEGSERGCQLVREIRSQLLTACGETEKIVNGSAGDSTLGQ